MSIKEAIYDLADEYGSSAPHVGTKLDAIDALTDALAGENKAKSKSVEEAVANLKSYLPETPTGNLNITANGDNINVAQYATASVDVQPQSYSLSVDQSVEHGTITFHDPTASDSTPITSAKVGQYVFATCVPDTGYVVLDPNIVQLNVDDAQIGLYGDFDGALFVMPPSNVSAFTSFGTE